jgi:hypothetical protein
MIKRIFFCIILIVAAVAVQAQGMDKGHHIEFYGGTGIPVGNFGKPLFGRSDLAAGQQASLDFQDRKSVV